jgi:hypothetical protein
MRLCWEPENILRHMRVRASLSAQDDRDILRFLNA